jgi:four helix bundle protein
MARRGSQWLGGIVPGKGLMGRRNEIQERSYAFAVRVVKLSRELGKGSTNRVLTSQLLRSGTSIGANVEEAIGGQSRKDFLSKLRIARKESRESHYWLRLLGDAEVGPRARLEEITSECEQITKILTAIILTTESKGNS